MTEEKEEKLFEAKGSFREKGKQKKFTKIIRAPSQNIAIEKLMSEFGGRNKVSRRHILVEEIKEIAE